MLGWLVLFYNDSLCCLCIIKTPHLAGFLLIPVFSQAANCGGLILVSIGFVAEPMIEVLLVLPRLP